MTTLRKWDILVVVLIWIGTFVATVFVGVRIADDDPSTDDGAALALPFMMVAAGLSLLYVLVRERRDRARKRRLGATWGDGDGSRRGSGDLTPPNEPAVVYTSSARFRDNAGQFALAAGLWAIATVVAAIVIGFGEVAFMFGGFLALGVLLVLHRRRSKT